ncbi:ribosomal protein S18 [Hypoxylon rubiginosum]|uniref:Ribosomal protein S18 n=1 Tax=Hypoxylon rubiginosum TaxID=110542 RepID=A0ACC0DD72_9PEZI|nr:ribosomal protein S18 [Hypoxylon rubiginosum]
MPPRIPILTAIRHPQNHFRSQTAGIATTSPSQSIRRDVQTTTSSLLNIDDSISSSSSPSSSSNYNSRPNPTHSASDIYEAMRSRTLKRKTTMDDVNKNVRHDDYARQMTRRWNVGEVYAPHDLSPSEMAKWRRNQARKKDLVDMLGLRPLDMYRNFSVISEFMTSHGRIKKSVETGLRPPNQRKMAKAIRRAIGLGIHPSVHHHPELLMRDMHRIGTQNIASIKKDYKM